MTRDTSPGTSQAGVAGIVDRIRKSGRGLRAELGALRLIVGHPETPLAAKVLLGAAVAYAASPVDLIPDFIPVLGYLDDAIIVPGLAFAALRMVPPEVVSECRAAARKEPDTGETVE